MTDVDPGISRLIFDLPNEHLPEFLSTLGDFILTHDLSIGFSATPTVVTSPSPSNEIEETAELYNPILVDWVKDTVSGTDIAVVTPHTYDTFFMATRTGRNLNPIRPILRALSSEHNPHEPELESCGYFDEETGQAVGVRASRTLLLCDRLKTGTFCIPYMGPKNIESFSEFCDVLIIARGTQAQKAGDTLEPTQPKVV